MIDWYSLLANSLWILALSAALAVLGTASWRASLEGVRVREVLNRRGSALSLWVCLVAFCAGLALSVPSTLEKAAWTALTLLAIVQFGTTLRK